MAFLVVVSWVAGVDGQSIGFGGQNFGFGRQSFGFGGQTGVVGRHLWAW